MRPISWPTYIIIIIIILVMFKFCYASIDNFVFPAEIERIMTKTKTVQCVIRLTMSSLAIRLVMVACVELLLLTNQSPE